MKRPPDFADLVEDNLSEDERTRLLRVHELLLEAGPPPELPPQIAMLPDAKDNVRVFPRRRRRVLALLAAALAAAAFGGGYLAGDRGADFEVTREVAMRGIGAQPQARALIQVGQKDEHGNWPMILKVSGLKPTKPEGYYELMLARDGKPIAPCGSFNVRRDGTAEVQLNAPYPLTRTTEWVVTVHPERHIENPPIVMTT